MTLLPGLDYPTQVVVGPITIRDNQLTPSVLFSVAVSTSPNIIVEYSIVRGTINEVGNIEISTDGSVTSLTNENTGTNLSGVTLVAALNAGNLEVQYTSTATGQAGQFWYTIRNITN